MRSAPTLVGYNEDVEYLTLTIALKSECIVPVGGAKPGMLSHMNQHDFSQAIERYRGELQTHCYRMFGSIQDAEDMVQETFLRAWKHRESYVTDLSLRAWLYKIATNVCLDTLKKRRRRVIPQTLAGPLTAADPIPPAITDPIWIDPYPDELIDLGDAHPEQRVLAHESIKIAFLTALQLLPPRQRAVLILSDVLDWSASETAVLLETTIPAVKSALHRARARMETVYFSEREDAAPPDRESADMRALLAQYVRAWEEADIDGLIALLRDDASFSMPPIPSWYQGRANIRQIVGKTVFSGPAVGRWKLHPTRANGQIAFGLYRMADDGIYHEYGIQVLTLVDCQIADIITFRKPQLVARFSFQETL